MPTPTGELQNLLARYRALKCQGLPMRRAHKVLARERGYKATKTIEGLLSDARLFERIQGAWEDSRDSVACGASPAPLLEPAARWSDPFRT